MIVSNYKSQVLRFLNAIEQLTLTLNNQLYARLAYLAHDKVNNIGESEVLNIQ